MNNKHFILVGHTGNVKDLEFVLNDSPNCQGKSELKLCTYSTDCRRKCYENYSRDCKVRRYFDLIKTHYDKFGKVLR